MSSVQEPHVHLEVGHILFLDIVGDSKLLADEQKELVQQLNQIVRETEHFLAAEAEGKLTRLPTGDGMVLVFTNNPEARVECALEISNALQSHPKPKVRMGIHSGPVNPFAYVNDQPIAVQSLFGNFVQAFPYNEFGRTVLSFPRGVGVWSLAARQETRQGRIPPIAQSLPKTNQRSDIV
jgi:hypothetical protein